MHEGSRGIAARPERPRAKLSFAGSKRRNYGSADKEDFMTKNVNPDLFAPVDTEVNLDPHEQSLIKKAKENFDYSFTISGNSCSNCVHRIQTHLHKKIFKCLLFGFRTNNEKICKKFRIKE